MYRYCKRKLYRYLKIKDETECMLMMVITHDYSVQSETSHKRNMEAVITDLSL